MKVTAKQFAVDKGIEKSQASAILSYAVKAGAVTVVPYVKQDGVKRGKGKPETVYVVGETISLYGYKEEVKAVEQVAESVG